MNELQFIINAICQRRGVALVKIESVFFNVAINFGLGAKDLLAADANAFYYLRNITVTNTDTVTGNARLTFTANAVIGSSGAGAWTISGNNTTTREFKTLECDSFAYQVNTHSAGGFVINAECFKVTYA